MTERLIAPISGTELNRRWQSVRAIMDAHDLDALILQNSNDWLGGYVRWFIGTPANNAYPRTIVFPREGGMTIIEQGPFDGLREPDGTDPAWRGVARVLTTPSYVSAAYTAEYDAQLAIGELARIGARRVGWVAPAAAYHGFGRAIEALAGTIERIDVTDAIDRIKAVKSAEEWAAIEATIALQDDVIAAVSRHLTVGLHDFEIAAFAQYESQRLGAEQGIFISSSSPSGRAAVFRPRHEQGRRIERGDSFALLVETNGPGGFYGEIARMFVLGEASADMRTAIRHAIDAQAHTVERLKPGAAAADIADAHDAYMRGNGLPVERRLYSHGQGYDMVERPLIRADETMRIEEGMSIVVHPGYVTEQVNALICDNYRVTADGAIRLHTTPQGIIEVG